MARTLKLGGSPYAPAVRGGLADPRSTGAGNPSTQRPTLMDRRSTR
jgi:hypothetical protein